MEDDLKWQTTSNGRRPQMEDDLQCKTTSNIRRPPMEDDLQWKTTSNGRQPLMEDDLKSGKNKIEDDLNFNAVLLKLFSKKNLKTKWF